MGSQGSLSSPGIPVSGNGDTAPRAWMLHGLLWSTMLMWSLAFVGIKYLVDEGVGPTELTLMRFLAAAPGFLLILAWQKREGKLPKLEGQEEWARLLVLALLGVAGYHLCLNYAEQYVSAGMAAVVISFNPAFTYILAMAFLGERFRASRLLGLLIALVGVVTLVLYGQEEELSSDRWIAVLILICAPFCWSIYNIVGKPLFSAHDALGITAYFNLLGLVFLLPLARRSLYEQTLDLDGLGWASVLFLAYGATLIATVFYNYGLRFMPATKVSTYIYLIPVMATVFGIALLEEPFNREIAFGSVLVILGVILVEGKVAKMLKSRGGSTEEVEP